MRIKKLTSVLVCATALSASIGAIAGTVSGSPVTASANIVFSEPVVFTNTLTAVSDMTSGAQSGSPVVANGEVSFSSGATKSVALSFGSGAYIESNQRISVAGASNSDNKAIFIMADSDGNSLSNSNAQSAQDGIPDAFSIVGVESGVAKYSVVVLENQTIAADTYNVSVTAYAYTV